MSKILKLTIEFDDHIKTLEGAELEKWDHHVTHMSIMAQNRTGNQNLFDTDPINWNIVLKQPEE